MIEHKFYPEANFILAVFHGKISSEELDSFIDALIDLGHEEGNIRGLTVLCENVKTSHLGYDEVFAAGSKMKKVKFRKDSKNAIVAKTLLGYGMSRMYQVATEIADLDEVKVYKGNGLEEAIEWLGVGHMSDEIKEYLASCETAS